MWQSVTLGGQSRDSLSLTALLRCIRNYLLEWNLLLGFPLNNVTPGQTSQISLKMTSIAVDRLETTSWMFSTKRMLKDGVIYKLDCVGGCTVVYSKWTCHYSYQSWSHTKTSSLEKLIVRIWQLINLHVTFVSRLILFKLIPFLDIYLSSFFYFFFSGALWVQPFSKWYRLQWPNNRNMILHHPGWKYHTVIRWVRGMIYPVSHCKVPCKIWSNGCTSRFWRFLNVQEPSLYVFRDYIQGLQNCYVHTQKIEH